MKSATSRSPGKAGYITWQLTQVFWVGGLWLVQFVVLPAIVQSGLAPLLVEEIARRLLPLIVGLALVCAGVQTVTLMCSQRTLSLWGDVRGQLLLATLLMGASYLLVGRFWPEAEQWQSFSYIIMACCGLMLVIQPAPSLPSMNEKDRP